MDGAWFRTHERRRHHQLVADDDAVLVQVMAVDLPAPRLIDGRLTEDREEVGPLAEAVVLTRKLCDQLVDGHDASRLLETSNRQCGAQHIERQLSNLLAEILQHDSVTEEVHVHVEPGPPLI